MNPAFQTLMGKTLIIKAIDDSCKNMLAITFSDGTSLVMEAVNALPSIGLIGIETQLKT